MLSTRTLDPRRSGDFTPVLLLTLTRRQLSPRCCETMVRGLVWRKSSTVHVPVTLCGPHAAMGLAWSLRSDKSRPFSVDPSSNFVIWSPLSSEQLCLHRSVCDVPPSTDCVCVWKGGGMLLSDGVHPSNHTLLTWGRVDGGAAVSLSCLTEPQRSVVFTEIFHPQVNYSYRFFSRLTLHSKCKQVWILVWIVDSLCVWPCDWPVTCLGCRGDLIWVNGAKVFA